MEKDARELATGIVESLPWEVAVLDAEGRLVTVNRSWRAAAPDWLVCDVGTHFARACLASPALDGPTAEHVELGVARVLSGRSERFELQHRRRIDGDVRWMLLAVSAAPHGAVVSIVDVTTASVVGELLSEAALTDPLTSLPNRQLVEDRLRVALARAARHDVTTAVLFCDLDGFKAVNDELGHAVGDEVLIAVARRLARSLRSEDTCGRWGGDEFVAIVEVADRAELDIVVRRLVREVERTVHVHGHDVSVAVSVGAVVVEPGGTVRDVIRLADAAMYEAKHSGRVAVVAGLGGRIVDLRNVHEPP